MRRLLLLLLVLGASTAAAQTSRYVQATQLWPELQGELALRNGDYLLLALRGERAASSGDLAGRRLGFDVRRARLAYEHFGRATWSYGATVQLVGDGRGSSVIIPEVLLRHRSPIFGGFTFGQRLSLERNFGSNGSNPLGSGSDDQTWTRLRVDLAQLFPLSSDAAGLALRPRLSYEASTHLRFQKATTDQDERTIQYTSLRGEVGVRVSERFDITPWFAYQSSYLITLPQYDKNGLQTSGGNVNLVYPTAGFDLRFTMQAGGVEAAKKQLPTQH